MSIETINTGIFFIFLIPSFAMFYYIMKDCTRLISHRYYSLSVLTFIGLATLLFATYLISPTLMALCAGISIGMWGALIYLSYKIKKEENSKKWRTY